MSIGYVLLAAVVGLGLGHSRLGHAATPSPPQSPAASPSPLSTLSGTFVSRSVEGIVVRGADGAERVFAVEPSALPSPLRAGQRLEVRYQRLADGGLQASAVSPAPILSLLALAAALFAGLLSFVSPCVLPIVPGYLSFISGVNLAQYKTGGTPRDLSRRVLTTSLVFVLGFSTVFVALGATASLVGSLLQEHKRTLGMVGGVIVIVLGLHTAGIFKIRWLLAERRASVQAKPLGLVGAYVVGLAFAFGWTPCIGPILGAILVYAMDQETIAQGIVLLVAYSAGLGIPFLGSALAVNWFFKASSRLRRSMRIVEVVSGLLLIAVGLLLVTDRLTLIAQYVTRLFPALTRIG